MKSNVFALVLCLCILLVMPFAAGAEDEIINESQVTTALVETTQTTEVAQSSSKSLVDLNDCEITVLADDLVYNGKEQKAEVVIKKDGVAFSKDIDFTLSYENNIDAGVANVVITAIENDESALKGSVTKTFEIAKKDLNSFKTKTISKSIYIYSGEENKPGLNFKDGDLTAIQDKDYTLSYENNLNAGTATVTATGIGNYSGSFSRTFKIEKKNINDFSKKTISQKEFIYSGEANCPELIFSNKTTTAVLGVDYTLSYKNNVNTGIAKVTANGIGNYKGSYTKTFTIRPSAVTVLKNKAVSDKTFTLSWTKAQGNVNGYRIYRLNPETKEWVYAVYTKNTYYNVGGREPATVYTYMVKAYKSVDGKTILGEPSNTRVVVMRPEKTATASSAYKGKNFIFKWEKQKADGFEIRYSKYQNFKKGVKTKVVKSKKATSAKVKLSSKTQYYYQIRAYKTYNGKNYYGAWSQKCGTKFSNVYSKFSTTFYSPAGRTTNIKVACNYIDGTILKPGEVFSFNEVVGKRTPDRGFKLATVYSGQETLEGYGGGVCQVSTTIFNAVLYANLEVVERYQHSMTVHYVPYGRDAAISWGSADFKFKNTTNATIKISAKVYDNSKIEIKLLTDTKIKPKKVSLNVSSSYYNEEFRRYYLTRSVGGKVNYSTSSIY